MNDILKVYDIKDQKTKKYFGEGKAGKDKREGKAEIRQNS